jgi:hypothetical protein
MAPFLFARGSVMAVLTAMSIWCTFGDYRNIIQGTIMGASTSSTLKFMPKETLRPFEDSKLYYTVDDDISNRSARFPSFDERLRVYMTHWYAPPCSDEQRIHYSFSTLGIDNPELIFSHNTANITKNPLKWRWWSLRRKKKNNNNKDKVVNISSSIVSSDIHYLSHTQDGGTPNCTRKHSWMSYCRDVDSTVWPSMDRMNDWTFHHDNTTQDMLTMPTPPILMQFGDMTSSTRLGPTNVPVVMKTRLSVSREKGTSLTAAVCRNETPSMFARGQDHMNAILWKLNNHRHYGRLDGVAAADTMWKRKHNKTVFRGVLSGGATPKFLNASHLDACLYFPRCRAIYNSYDSALVDARLSVKRRGFPEMIEGRNIIGGKMSMTELLRYKGLLILEGNDVASGLKWAMYSQSVVLMQRPTHTSWAMEELLEPWVHYIPVHINLTDIEEKTQWIIDNDKAAQKISERARLWIHDLFYHPDAKKDEELLQEEILRRYRAQFEETARE